MKSLFKQENKLKNNKIIKDICHQSFHDKIISIEDLNIIN